MAKILVVTDPRLNKEIWEENMKNALGTLYEKQEIRYVESLVDTPTSIPWSTSTWNGIREARGDPEQLKNEIDDVEILVVHMAPVTADVMDAGKNLKIICAARGGPVNVDAKAAASRGIPVTRTVGRNAPPVADHTIGLLLAEIRNISKADSSVKDGNYFKDRNIRKSWHDPVLEMEEKTLGIVGFGQVGRQVALRSRGFGLKVIAYDPYVDKTTMKKYDVAKVDLEYLLEHSDFISIHARETQETFHMIGEKEFNKMKPSCYFINTARGSIVDEASLVKTLTDKRIAGAAIDVFEDEPLKSDNPLLKLENVTITPHTAGRSDKVYLRSVRLVTGTVARYLKGEQIPSEELVIPPDGM
jgi:D-3-phosphoglycerate dehydrogenase